MPQKCICRQNLTSDGSRNSIATKNRPRPKTKWHDGIQGLQREADLCSELLPSHPPKRSRRSEAVADYEDSDTLELSLLHTLVKVRSSFRRISLHPVA